MNQRDGRLQHLAPETIGRSRCALLLTVALAALAPSAVAEEPRPGSLLLFPEYDNRDGSLSLVTVTNASPSESVEVEWVYREEEQCLEFNRTEVLTPGDTFTVITGAHNPQFERGFLYVFAKNDLDQAIVFDWLIGTSTKISGLDVFEYGIDPIAFQGIGEEGSPTDLDNDGIRDLDGNEYTQVPDQLLVPRFFGQERDPGFQSELVLINLSGGGSFEAVVDFLIFNDNEIQFSAEYTFRCWTKVPLLQISGVFSQKFLEVTDNNPDEILGAPQIESGWFQIDGVVASSPAVNIADPAIVGFLVERAAVIRTAAELPFGLGRQDNGALLESGIDPLTGSR